MIPSGVVQSEWTYQFDKLHTDYLAVITPRSMLANHVMIPAFNPNRGVAEVCKLDGELVDELVDEISQVSFAPARGQWLMARIGESKYPKCCHRCPSLHHLF